MSELAVFIHSTGMGPSMWSRLIAAVPDGPAALAPANRGYPPAAPIPRGTPCSVADEVAHLRGLLPPETTALHLCGHSYGGLVAMELARSLATPGAGPAIEVRSLWLYEPVLFGSLRALAPALPDDVAREVTLLFGGEHAFLDERTGGDDAWLEGFVDYWNRPGAWAGMPQRAQAASRLIGWKMFQEVRSVSLEPRPFDAYRFVIPLTLVTGERSTAAAREMVRHLAAENPGAHVDRLPDLGHMGMIEAPDRVAPSLRRHWEWVRG